VPYLTKEVDATLRYRQTDSYMRVTPQSSLSALMTLGIVALPPMLIMVFKTRIRIRLQFTDPSAGNLIIPTGTSDASIFEKFGKLFARAGE
jgi:hypothetical protein